MRIGLRLNLQYTTAISRVGDASAVPAGALQQRNAEYIFDRASNYIVNVAQS